MSEITTSAEEPDATDEIEPEKKTIAAARTTRSKKSPARKTAKRKTAKKKVAKKKAAKRKAPKTRLSTVVRREDAEASRGSSG